ncbi:MAG TPA: Ig domain-containing protein, partial [Thermoanaerobaculia bacterium]|nr:Ig domain-containing protein [Thermoanaerobaculia bacterium]
TANASTVFGIRVQNATTTCSFDLPDVVTYTPVDTSCKAAVAITTTSPLPDGLNNNNYTFTFQAIGGTTPYTWTITGGTLPAGMTNASLAPTTGVFSGTPTATGTYLFTVTVTDALSTTSSRTFSWTVN